jgi:hypothetical protein
MLEVSSRWLAACPYCEEAPNIAGRSPLDYAVAIAAAVVVAVAVGHSVKCLINPGENAANHIKTTVLDDAVVYEGEDPT